MKNKEVLSLSHHQSHTQRSRVPVMRIISLSADDVLCIGNQKIRILAIDGEDITFEVFTEEEFASSDSSDAYKAFAPN
jgi:hypothetical protein